MNKTCKYCGAAMEDIRTEEVAGTTYHYMKCTKCQKEVARREE